MGLRLAGTCNTRGSQTCSKQNLHLLKLAHSVAQGPSPLCVALVYPMVGRELLAGAGARV
jgi:hypothetical protein